MPRRKPSKVPTGIRRRRRRKPPRAPLTPLALHPAKRPRTRFA
jgi:hypothetical protein